MTIRAKLYFGFVVVVLLPSIVISVVSGVISFQVGQQQIINQLESVATLKEAEIQTWVATLEDDLGAMVAEPDLARRIRILGEDSWGPETRYLSRSILQYRFREMVELWGRFEEFFLMDTDGAVIVFTDEALEDTIHSDQMYFREGLQGAYVSSPLYMPSLRRTTIVFTAPVVDAGGQTLGVLAGRTSLETLSEIMLERTGLGESGETYLVGVDHALLTASRFEEEGYEEGSTTIRTIGANVALDERVNSAGLYDNYRGIPTVGVYHWLPDLQVALLAEQDQQEAFGEMVTMVVVDVVVTLFSVLFALATALVVMRSVTIPLANLVRVVTRIADGDLTQRAAVSSRDEIGDLANAFNTMTDNLQRMVEIERASKAVLENTVAEYMIFVQRVAEGDLTTRLSLNDNGYTPDKEDDLYTLSLYTLGVNLNVMVDGLSGMAKQNREMASDISSAAAEILAATTQQIASATEQNTAVTQTMTTVDEVVTAVQQTAERAQSVAEASQQSVSVSREGQSAVSDTVDGMQLIQRRVEDIAENILALSGRTQQIGEIIETVNEIANQSKLLALNASIEAARAGEEGKGFAVVAMEVRQLAEQSRDATERVRDILSEIQAATNTTVMVTEEGSKGAESGMALVERAGEAIRDLAETIDESSQAVQQIAASAHQQTNGMEQLAAAMMSIKQASTQAAASTRQTECSAQDLTKMSRQMEEAVAQYQL